MKGSRRARRMERHHNRVGRKGGLHLVSLMDVFTILVFFLLVNTSSSHTLPSPDDITLPRSTAEAAAGNHNTVVMVTPEAILVNGERVVTRERVRTSEQPRIPPLAAALVRAAPGPVRAPESNKEMPNRGKLTIMADRQLPYRLIRQVMLTGTASGFTRISLAVLQGKQS